KKDKKKACQTSTIAHPGRAPKGKTATIGVEIITTLYTSTLENEGCRHPCGQCESKKRSSQRSRRSRINYHSRATGISFINQGGICGFFRKHRVGRIL
ncbi:hypothetical protein GGR53DRAFT_510226, partial [Hypoxylon sp. FL1150]